MVCAGFPDYLSKLHLATLKFAEHRMKEEEEAEAKKAEEAAAREEERRREEEEERKHDSSQPRSPEAWEVFLGGGPVLSFAEKASDPNDQLNYLLNKLMLLGT